MATTMVVLRRYSHPHEAQLALALLQTEGIPAVLGDANVVHVNWLLSNAVGGVKLLVPEDALPEAQRILDDAAAAPPLSSGDIDAEGPEDHEVCPYCGHDDLERVTLGRRWSFVSALLFLVPLLPVWRRTRCRACGNTWKS